MQIEQLIAANTAAIEANTEALKAVFTAGGITAPSNIVPITTETPKPAAKAAGKAKPAPETTPEPAMERPTKVAAPAESTAPDPLDPKTVVVVQGTEPEKPVIDVDATIQQIVDTFKAKMTAANDDPARKARSKTHSRNSAASGVWSQMRNSSPSPRRLRSSSDFLETLKHSDP